MTDLFSSTTSSRLPDFPWDKLAPFKQKAADHPDGIVDLSIGSPVDPVPDLVKKALADAADAPAYPTTIGTTTARQSAVDWLERRLDVPGVDPQTGVLPVIGTKELIMLLPMLLGVGAGDTVLIPDLAYPTYEAGAALARAKSVPVADVTQYDGPVAVAYLNSPRNPSGEITSAAELKAAVEWARANDVLLVNDECYVEFGWDEQPVSVLHPDVCGGSFDNLLAVHSLSKRSNLAGYRAGFVAGDERIVTELLAVRKHAGLMVPSPIQAAMAAAFADDQHVEEQRARYIRRRSVLREALTGAGWEITLSQGGLYLWAEHPSYDAYSSVAALSELGILVAPGAFYGTAGERNIRVALTGTDERIDAAVKRLHTQV
ncbi:succinyldiaminopimelate transaminase [Kribbella endophytica]